MDCNRDLTLEETELRLGLLGNKEPKRQTTPSAKSNKRCCLEMSSQESSMSSDGNNDNNDCAPTAKVQIVGWPPVRSYRKNSLQQEVGMYVKVSMDGAPYLRKINLKVYTGYPELLQALETMFKFTIGEYSESEGYNESEYMPTYEDKDGDWMLIGDVPWNMFISTCKRLRVMKASEARGLGCL